LRKVVLDTNLYIDWINHGLHESWMLGPGLVRHLSVVVVMELRAGAHTRAGQLAIDGLVRAYTAGGRLATPPASVFDRAGSVLRRLKMAGREVRSASLVNDVLIALGARNIGATLVTADRSDFEAIRDIEPFALEPISPRG
jgi:predicted nucleic acid-binding protein